MVARDHLIDFLKGLLAVMATQAIIAGLQYLGAHIPNALNFLGSMTAAVGAIKYHHV